MRLRMAAAGTVAAGAAAGAVLLATGSGEDGRAARAASSSVATTTIERRDLVEIEEQSGTLGYAGSATVMGRLTGTITWLPESGRVVRPDRALYRVDGSPVVLLSGRTPAYRPLQPGVSKGADVRALERNLRGLGYGELDVDGEWTAATTTAVKRWQDAHDLPQTGSIELGRVVFQPGSRRIADKAATLGAAAGTGPVLTTTSTRRQVTVALSTSRASLARRGDRVTVELPGGEPARGRITDVGTVATQTEDGASTIEVKVRLANAPDALDRAPVLVRFERSRASDVLAVPVTALLARPGGRYAVQVLEDGGRRIVDVEPGLYASGFVEITGSGLRAGLRVTNAAI